MFLRILLIFLVVYMIIRFFQSLFKPVITPNSQQRSQQYQDKRKKGEVTIVKKNTSSNKKVSENDGEYVDYEEV